MTKRPFICQHCGGEQVRVPKKRSTPQHRRQFAVFSAAWFHWPENHWFRPKNMAHLRYWLEVQAGRCEVVQSIKCETDDQAIRLAAAMGIVMLKSDDRNMFIEAKGVQVLAVRALSISYEELTHLEACRLFDEIANVIHAETGMQVDALLKETRNAA